LVELLIAGSDKLFLNILDKLFDDFLASVSVNFFVYLKLSYVGSA